jgi:epsilon-lactone hydrolase
MREQAISYQQGRRRSLYRDTPAFVSLGRQPSRALTPVSHATMPSWQARIVNAGVRALVRRRDWGDVRAVARRARIVLGAPGPYGWLMRQGLAQRWVRKNGVLGEWLLPATPRSGVILYIHGGGFVCCSASTHRPITASLVRRTGSALFSAEYRLAPEHLFPAALDDVIATYEWLVQSTSGARVAIAGDSAGGGLALSLAVHARDAGLPPPACVVGFSPWTDLAGTGATLHDNDGRDAMFRPENIPAFAAAYLGTASASDPRASPVDADLHGLPPMLLQVGSTELLLDDSRRVHDGVVATGGSSRLHVYDDVHHVWQMLTPFVPEAREALAEAAAFIRSHLDRA